MKKALALMTCGLVGTCALAVMTAEKPPDAYVKAMKDIDAAMQSVNTAIRDQDFDTISKNAVSIIDALPVVATYWTGKADDATKTVQTATKAAADLRVAAGLMSGEGVAYSAKELTDTCAVCHAAHREKLPDGSFQIK